jgi:hypothetical protein
MKPLIKELVSDLIRLDRCDEVLLILLHHHKAQEKHPSITTSEWHRELVRKIEETRIGK